jgi:hypothetical protein
MRRGTAAAAAALGAALAALLAGGDAAGAPTDARQQDAREPAVITPPPAAAATRIYRNERHGFGLSYPAEFLLDRATLPADGGGAEFWTADGSAGFAVYGGENASGRSIRDLFAEARANIAAQDGGRVTYTRLGTDWFVVSGVADGRIVYQRTVMGRGGRLVATLYVSYPEAEKARWDAAVTLMSRSFGFGFGGGGGGGGGR